VRIARDLSAGARIGQLREVDQDLAILRFQLVERVPEELVRWGPEEVREIAEPRERDRALAPFVPAEG
jgi:hypothetical protein